MNRTMERRLIAIETRRLDIRRLTDEQLDARIAQTVSKLLDTVPARALLEMFATMPDALVALGLQHSAEQEKAHATH